ncbi:hypothetical protein AXG93_1104s1110 [Marchantia polymorpha subsp. ruderalis]|uniref:Uncharacterized protein n=1 Tax=Marchantia polymorpha subsp. ruderalis TaxID=1480154 RepID=A0A176WN86_MARPO|nr:hypothetical protein AXG93_1104s1110 [Marchantia polymorpha subsp. ruderalis]
MPKGLTVGASNADDVDGAGIFGFLVERGLRQECPPESILPTAEGVEGIGRAQDANRGNEEYMASLLDGKGGSWDKRSKKSSGSAVAMMTETW